MNLKNLGNILKAFILAVVSLMIIWGFLFLFDKLINFLVEYKITGWAMLVCLWLGVMTYVFKKGIFDKKKLKKD